MAGKWVTLMVKSTSTFKEAVDVAAKEKGVGMSEFVRGIVAGAIGYDLSSDDALDGRGRPTKYESEEARTKARREADRVRQDHRRKLVELAERRAREEGAASLEDWLRRKGITVEDPETEAVKVSA